MIGDVPPDLRQLLDEALTRVHQDITRVWLRASLTYESGVQDKKAILVGGSWSPFFLDKRAENPSPWDMVGAGALIYSPRILHVDAIDESDKLEDWVAPLQGFARAADGLLLIADSVTNSELLATLVINNARGTLACALVKPGKEPPPSLWKVNGRKYDTTNKAQQALVRRTATAILFEPKGEAQLRSHLTDIAVVAVGGKDSSDIKARLDITARLLLDMEERFES
ncbi:MAG: hypothetical protein U0105_19505 [Candidatus Obscuribacterales bacterium]